VKLSRLAMIYFSINLPVLIFISISKSIKALKYALPSAQFHHLGRAI